MIQCALTMAPWIASQPYYAATFAFNMALTSLLFALSVELLNPERLKGIPCVP